MRTAALFFAAIFVTGCTARERVVGVQNTFLEDVDITAQKENLPFKHAWIKPGKKKEDYRYIMFKPIRTEFIPKDAWVRSSSPVLKTEAEYNYEAKELAKYFEERILAEMKVADGNRLQVVSQPGPQTLVVDIALTELEFSHPIARAASLAAPVPGTGPAMATITDPHVAFAARVNDAETGELVATLADRKFPPLRIVDLNKLTVTSSAREVCSLWARTFAEAINSDGMTKIKEKNLSLLTLW